LNVGLRRLVIRRLLERYKVLKLYSLLLPHARLLAAALIASGIATVLGVIPPLFTRAIIDQGVLKGDARAILLYSGALAAVYVVSTTVSIVSNYCNRLVSGKVALDLRSRVFTKTLELGAELYEKAQVGDIVARLYGYVDRVQRFIVSSFETVILSSFQLAAMMVIVFTLNWKLSLILLIPLPLYVFGLLRFQPRIRTLFVKRWSRVSRMSAYATSLLNAILLVKLTGREQAERERFDAMAGEVFEAEMEATRYSLKVLPWLNLLLSLASLGVLYAGGLMVAGGELTLGTLTAFLAYVWQVYGPIRAIAGLIPDLAEAESAYEKLAEIMETEPKVTEPPDAVEFEVKGRVEVRDVWFEYAPGRPVLRGVNLRVEPGEAVGIVGPNGSGKTTLVRLLVRLFDPTRGAVLLDGVDLRKVKMSSLRGQVILVPQEPTLLPGSVAYNIAYGADSPDPLTVLYAAWLCGAHRFIVELPLAYDSDVGEQGKALSGGQRQLVCLARALVLKPKVLILDEATSNVHVELEEALMERVLGYLRGTTVIAISHRPTLNKFVNRVILMSEGRVLGEARGGLAERPLPPPPLKVIDARRLRVRDRGAWLEAEVDGLVVGELRARLPFPLTNPKVLLLYKDPDDPLVVEDWTLLDEESKLAVARHLAKEHGLVLAKLVEAYPLGMGRRALAVNVVMECEDGRVEVEVPTSDLLSLDGLLVVATPNRVYLIEPSAIASRDAAWRVAALATTPPSPFGSYGVGLLVAELKRLSARPQG
jgi:ABC-type multidrug transport system fused ATPase/permease subunit